MDVHIIERRRGRETVVAVRSCRRRRVLHASVGVGPWGATAARAEALAYAQRRGHVIVPRPARLARAA